MTIIQIAILALVLMVGVRATQRRLKGKRLEKLIKGWKVLSVCVVVGGYVGLVAQDELLEKNYCLVGPEEAHHRGCAVSILTTDPLLTFTCESRFDGLVSFHGDSLDVCFDSLLTNDVVVFQASKYDSGEVLVGLIESLRAEGQQVVICVNSKVGPQVRRALREHWGLWVDDVPVCGNVDGTGASGFGSNLFKIAVAGEPSDSLFLQNACGLQIMGDDSMWKPTGLYGDGFWRDENGNCRRDSGESSVSGIPVGIVEEGEGEGHIWFLGSEYPFFDREGLIENDRSVLSVLGRMLQPHGRVRVDCEVSVAGPMEGARIGDEVDIEYTLKNESPYEVRNVSAVLQVRPEFVAVGWCGAGGLSAGGNLCSVNEWSRLASMESVSVTVTVSRKFDWRFARIIGVKSYASRGLVYGWCSMSGSMRGTEFGIPCFGRFSKRG